MVGAGSTVPVSVSNGLESVPAAEASNVPTQHPAVLQVEPKAAANGNVNASGGSPAMRIPARVPPPQPEPVVVVRSNIPAIPPHSHNAHIPNIPPPVSDAAIPLVPPSNSGEVFVSHAQAVRDQSFRVRTALTKGWRKGKKTRKSVGGGRGPGFTNREVDGLLELLEDAVPVTREEWEQVRGRHAVRFPGTSRSIDSIRRKFAKVYLARVPAGMADGTTALIVRRAKCIRERMAARAVSLDDEDAAMENPDGSAAVPSAVGHVEAMDTSGMHDDDDGPDEHHHMGDNEGAAATVTHEQELEAVQVPVSAAVAAAPGLAPVSLAMVVSDLGTTTPITTNGSDTHPHAHEPVSVTVAEETAVEITASPSATRPPPRKKQHTIINPGEEGGDENLLSVFKMYMAQEAQNREEERRMRAEEREQQKTLDKAREERETRRHEQFMQILMLLAQNKQTRES